MKTVLMICDFEEGGGAEKVYSVTSSLLADNYNIETYAGSQGHTFSKNLFEYVFSLKHYKHISKKLAETYPDICHLHIYSHVLSPSILVALKKYRKKNPEAKIVYTAHDYHLIYPNSTLLRYKRNNPKIASHSENRFKNLFHRVDGRGIFFSWVKKIQWHFNYTLLGSHLVFDKIICPSEFNAQMLRDKKYSSDIQVIRNPIDSTLNENVAPPNGPLKLIFFGRLSQEKGLLNFIHLINGSSHEFTLDIYGKGDQEEEVRQVIADYSMNDVIKLHGFISHQKMMKKLVEFHAMVIPSSWYEVAPLSIIEAAMNGLRVVGSDLGGIRELAMLTGNGSYLFTRTDRDSLHQSLSNLRNDIENEAKIDVGESLAQFTKESYKQAIIDCYESK